MTAKQNDTLNNDALQRLAERTLARYPAALQGKLSLLCRSENATFLLEAGGKRYALRLHRPDYHQYADIVSELQWLDALRETGIEVPQAVADSAGETVQTLVLEEGTVRHAVLFHWIEGEMPGTDVDPRAFRQLGNITARLHQHSRRWQQPAGFQRIIWDHHTMVSAQSHWGDWRDAPNLRIGDRAIVEQAIARVGSELAEFGKAPHNYGLIHADLRLTNLLLHKGETRVIDFDDCGFGWYLHDLAAAISFVEHHPRAAEWVDNWITGYEQVAHISDAEMDRVPTLLIQRRIQLLAWAGSHAETEMAHSLGPQWADHSVRLCRRYLETSQLPVGA
ncbi:serine kinase [bacteria symbiont BFo1 of Frankliniella occidentalis]|jgi:Ser/Thr protein kinase RdoA (MazF antagonist)|uniref:phosphotransferase enzyme family protein n=1 Tax=Erwinia TaxID=551 RepID=UPI0006646573|nr:phosphotransferase [Erwinia sp. V90_4]KMV69285.1 serine kinase [bacteria symbiont BFo1 of Frankliniella occidentalis]KYP84117.1 serine kinase [bacteria symbiont BFo1 of Frankliniella occidentalis]KYP89496.1 serine kinase [bacteria symbiont BFo1 of Frankliniella occidentalis]MDI3440508.1 phosphotransferase [Erwinia sp. V90_4]